MIKLRSSRSLKPLQPLDKKLSVQVAKHINIYHFTSQI